MRAGPDSFRGFVVAMSLCASVMCVSAASFVEPPSRARAQAQHKTQGDFIRTANEAAMMAVAAGKLAEKQAGDQNVKTFGRRIADEHTKALKELAALSKSRHIVHPEFEDAKKFPVDLAKLRGPAFDTAFMALMVMGYEAAVALFDAESRDGHDPEVKAWATGKLPSLKAHLKDAQTLQSRGR